MNVRDVEQQFTAKLGDMSTFDSFMDYNVILYTGDHQIRLVHVDTLHSPI